jgi:hypothetical protein
LPQAGHFSGATDIPAKSASALLLYDAKMWSEGFGVAQEPARRSMHSTAKELVGLAAEESGPRQ